MQTIWKYQLDTGENKVYLPEGAIVLSVQCQYDTITVWALVNTDNVLVPHQFHVIGTGWDVEGYGLPEYIEFIGTVQQLDGNLVWHVFHNEVEDVE